jgi:hypothetical protein
MAGVNLGCCAIKVGPLGGGGGVSNGDCRLRLGLLPIRRIHGSLDSAAKDKNTRDPCVLCASNRSDGC